MIIIYNFFNNNKIREINKKYNKNFEINKNTINNILIL